jgi:ABC-type amino acid transport substrate-binding protein
MRKFLLTFCLLSTILPSSYAKEIVKAGLNIYFEPMVILDESGNKRGFSIDILKELNKVQNKYEFRPVFYPTKRRWRFYEDRQIDIVMFDDPSWGWSARYKINVSKNFIKGKDVYIALKANNRDQSFFKDFNAKKMIGVSGYHYGFLNKNTANYKLKESSPLLTLLKDEASVIKFLELGRGEIAVLSLAFINGYIERNLHLKDKFFISKASDTDYNYRVLARPGIKPSIKEIDLYIEKLKQSGVFKKLRHKYGLVPYKY